MKKTCRSRWAVRPARLLLWAAPLYAAALITLTVDASALPFDASIQSANIERAHIRRIGNIIGISVIGAFIAIPLGIALIRHRRTERTDWPLEDADPADAE